MKYNYFVFLIMLYTAFDIKEVMTYQTLCLIQFIGLYSDLDTAWDETKIVN